MSACEAWSDPYPGREGCLWCGHLKGEHRAGDCRTCLGYGYLIATETANVTADRTLDVEGEPALCGTCRGAGIVDREGQPMKKEAA